MPLMDESFPELGLEYENCREMSWIESVLYMNDGKSDEPIEVLLDGNRNVTKGFFKAKSDYVTKPISEIDLEAYGIIQYYSKWQEKGNLAVAKHLGWINKLYSLHDSFCFQIPKSSYLNYRDLDIGINTIGPLQKPRFGVKVKLVPVPTRVTAFNVVKTLEEGATKLIYKWQNIANKLPEELYIRIILTVDKNDDGIRTIRANFNSLFLGTVDQLMPLMDESFPELGLEYENCREMSWIESVLYMNDGKSDEPIEVLLDGNRNVTKASSKLNQIM
ncbi:berberine bridge enzyme-like 13 [Quercus suber]|uniref:Berberine bridge enzyme-like 13 n=1 Tax=Quercus suber TaxID=58331 RepID=A0AAW0JHT5_QUESU